MKRRSFLTKTLGGSAILGAGLLSMKDVLATWSNSIMTEKDAKKATRAITGGSASVSDKIKIKAPEIAENGAVVPIDVDATALGNVQSISILVEKNPRVVGAVFEFDNNALGYAATRIKMGKSSNVVAVVKADGKVYKNHKEVKVTIGGCGG